MRITKTMGKYRIEVRHKGEGVIPDFEGDGPWGWMWHNIIDPGDYGYATDFKTAKDAMKDAKKTVSKWVEETP